MTLKVKIFEGNDVVKLESRINLWLASVRPKIARMSQSGDDWKAVITFLYVLPKR